MSVFVVIDSSNSSGCCVYLLAAEAIAEKYHRVNHVHRARCDSDHAIKECPFYDRVKVITGDFLDV